MLNSLWCSELNSTLSENRNRASVSATSLLARARGSFARLASFHLNSHEIYSVTFPRRVKTTFTTLNSHLSLAPSGAYSMLWSGSESDICYDEV